MYYEYFGLKESPFSIAPDPRYLYMSEQHREALAHLVYGFSSDGGFVLLTGEVGTGKTTVCRCLLDQVPENSAIAFILNPKLTVEELLATVCDEFGIMYQENSSIKIFIDLINNFLFESHAQGRKTVLIIDEAQNLSPDVLEQLRLLTNLETSHQKLLQIILLGQPELRDKLAQPELRQLSQRIIARYHLGSLSRQEIGAYLSHRLAVAGSREQLFSEGTINHLYKLTGGVPRLINVICDRSLLGTYTRGEKQVSKSIMKSAALEIFGQPGNDEYQRKKSAYTWVLPLIIVCAVGVVLASTYYKKTPLQKTTLSDDSVLNSDEVYMYKPAAVKDLLPDDSMQDEVLKWPGDQPVEQSETLAFQSLFRQWDAEYRAEQKGHPCDHALTLGLHCSYRSGNLRSIMYLNRPAVLRLYDKQGQMFFGTLTGLINDRAYITIGTDDLVVPVKSIEDLWFGDYLLLWKAPPHYKSSIFPGNKNPAVPWLAQQLAIIEGRSAPPDTGMTYTQALVNRVKNFQRSEGLKPDGVVGMQTFLRINSITGTSFPSLVPKNGEGS